MDAALDPVRHLESGRTRLKIACKSRVDGRSLLLIKCRHVLSVLA
jgi:hypothetical protein